MSSKLVALAASLFITVGAAAQNGEIEITGVWARATPGGTQVGATYLTILSPTADRLTGAATPVAETAELHQMTMANGVMTMRHLAAIDVPAGRPLSLKPGGVHIMLTGLKVPLRQGQQFPLTLTFAKAGTRAVTVTVEKPGAMGPAGAGGAATPMHH